jgi:hypothetical protein
MNFMPGNTINCLGDLSKGARLRWSIEPIYHHVTPLKTPRQDGVKIPHCGSRREPPAARLLLLDGARSVT